jgi:hypothetical protein
MGRFKPVLLGLGAGLIALSPCAAQPLSTTEEIGQVLSRGEAARAAHDGRALMAAAIRLRQLGARPVEGAPNLVVQWRKQAMALGARSPATPPFRGRILGPAYRYGEIAPHERFRTQQSFIAGQVAEVLVTPISKASLHLNVTDDAGQSVCVTSSGAGKLACRWAPRFSGSADIVIENADQSVASYYLVLK